jgi:Domain of unknown function (DUF4419)
MAIWQTGLIEENFIDQTPHQWIPPNFTTLTPTDVVTASVITVATLQAYFECTLNIICGLPHVALLEEKADWDNIVQRIKKSKEYGPETTA